MNDTAGSSASLEELEGLWSPSEKVETEWSRRYGTSKAGRQRRTYARQDPEESGPTPKRRSLRRSNTLPSQSGHSQSTPVLEEGNVEEMAFAAHTNSSEEQHWGQNRRPVPPKLQRFQRSHSISVMSRSTTVPVIPSASGFHGRSPSEGAFKPTKMARSNSLGIGTGNDTPSDENMDPNFTDTFDNLVSPKRSASEGTDVLRGAKKVRSSRQCPRPPLFDDWKQASKSLSNLDEAIEETMLSPIKSKPLLHRRRRSPQTNTFGASFGFQSAFTSPGFSISSAESSSGRGICASPEDLQDGDSMSPTFAPPSFAIAGKPYRTLACPADDSSFSLTSRRHVKKQSHRTARTKSPYDDDIDIDAAASSEDNASCDEVDDCASTGTLEATQEPQLSSFAVPLGCAVSHENLQPGDILGSMPSAKDLKFLVKSLRHSRKGHAQTSWHVLPKPSWEGGRRYSFIEWARSFGFSFRTGGGAVIFLQISKEKGSTLLQRLEEAYTLHKAGDIKPKKRTAPSPLPMLTSPLASLSISTPVYSAQRNLAFATCSNEKMPLRCAPTPSDDIADDLIHGVKSLSMQASQPRHDAFTTNLHNSFLDDDEEDDHYDMNYARQCLRPSAEHHASSQDFMDQLHGSTPARGRTSLGSTSGRLPFSSVGSSAMKPSGSSYDPMSPYPSMNNNRKNQSFVQTPVIKCVDQPWGSCPIDGRDWGASEKCGSGAVAHLFEQFKTAYDEAGFTDAANVCSLDAAIRSPAVHLCLDLELEDANKFKVPTLCTFGEELDLQAQAGTPSPLQSVLKGFVEPFMAVQQRLDRLHVVNDHVNNRRKLSMAKRNRMSLVASMMNSSVVKKRLSQPLFGNFLRATNLLPPSSLHNNQRFGEVSEKVAEAASHPCSLGDVCKTEAVLGKILNFLPDSDLTHNIALVSREWADAATLVEANVARMSVIDIEDLDEDEDEELLNQMMTESLRAPAERSWEQLLTKFPWACFLAEGGFKQVYKIFNERQRCEEALSVMNLEAIESSIAVGTELAISVMLSSLARRGICPNFVVTREIFACKFQPPESLWGCETNKHPKGKHFNQKVKQARLKKEPKKSGRFQYMRMELCSEGDVEEFLKQPDTAISSLQATQLLFQFVFALHISAERYSLKHYDIKLLNIFLHNQSSSDNIGDSILRYGVGSRIFALQQPADKNLIAKLADYGTANTDTATVGQPVTLAQFTTLENTPPEYMLDGDEAVQGHGHDCFNIGLCMLHLFTGHAPYEEILKEVVCPDNFKKKLRLIWEDEKNVGYSVVRNIILADVYKDDAGNIIEGEPDEVLYHTLYRYLVLFGIPKTVPGKSKRVWSVIRQCLGRKGRKKTATDVAQFEDDQRHYSILHGDNKFIERARTTLEQMDGGMDLLMSLVTFDPEQRASALDVLNSRFMELLQETEGRTYASTDSVQSFCIN